MAVSHPPGQLPKIKPLIGKAIRSLNPNAKYDFVATHKFLSIKPVNPEFLLLTHEDMENHMVAMGSNRPCEFSRYLSELWLEGGNETAKELNNKVNRVVLRTVHHEWVINDGLNEHCLVRTKRLRHSVGGKNTDDIETILKMYEGKTCSKHDLIPLVSNEYGDILDKQLDDQGGYRVTTIVDHRDVKWMVIQ